MKSIQVGWACDSSVPDYESVEFTSKINLQIKNEHKKKR